MAAVPHVGGFHPHGGRQFVLRSEVEGIAVTDAKGVGIDSSNRKQELRVYILIARLENPRVAGVPVKGAVHLIGALEAGCKPIWYPVEIRHARRVVDHAERTAEHHFFPGRIGNADLRREVCCVFGSFEAIAAVLGENEGARDAESGINGVLIKICPMAVLLVEAEIVGPAKAQAERNVRSDLIAILAKKGHSLLSSVQVERRGFAGGTDAPEKKAGKGESNLVAIGLAWCAGGIVREVERKSAGSAVAVDLLRPKVTAKGEAMPALRPSRGITDDSRGTDKVSLKVVTDKGFSVTIYATATCIGESDQRKVGGTGAPETEKRIPIAPCRRFVAIPIPVVSEVRHIQNVRRKRMRFTRAKFVRRDKLQARGRERPSVGASRRPNAAAIHQCSGLVVINPGS